MAILIRDWINLTIAPLKPSHIFANSELGEREGRAGLEVSLLLSIP